jgi:hypothetical protein
MKRERKLELIQCERLFASGRWTRLHRSSAPNRSQAAVRTGDLRPGIGLRNRTNPVGLDLDRPFPRGLRAARDVLAENVSKAETHGCFRLTTGRRARRA